MRLEAKQLQFGYPRRGKPAILTQISLQLQTGERVGLTAPSGSGKSTLCKLLAGYLPPDSGEVLLDGRRLSTYGGYCPVQMIWQHPELTLDPRIRLGESLHEAGPVEARLLEGLHIEPGWLDRFPAELSGGELQRFSIARALMPPVRFLLCDEITAMLDLITQAQIWEFLLQEARRRNLGLLIVSHHSPLLTHLCDRIDSLDSLTFPSKTGKHGLTS